MEDLGSLTALSRPTLSRAVSGLISKGFIEVIRTKRNLGRLSYNRYQLLPCITDETLKSSPCITGDTPTDEPISNTSTHKPISTMYNLNSHVRESHGRYKEVVVASEKWRPKGEDRSGDDDIGGIGLFDSEVPAVHKAKVSVDKRDPKTRGRRSQEEWTPADVAVEFSYQLCKKYPYLPGLLKTSELRGALASNRKKYGVTALVELEILRMFIGDPSKHGNAEGQPHFLYKRFLRMFTTHMDKALTNLGMPSRNQLAGIVEDTPSEEFVYASDGREFDNSIPGRRAMERYEEKLRVNNGV
jgi:hypothetical protein